MWHVICDTWQLIHDTWSEVNILSKFQVSSSYGLGVKVFWISEEGVCRTAPATPGLLNIEVLIKSLIERIVKSYD